MAPCIITAMPDRSPNARSNYNVALRNLRVPSTIHAQLSPQQCGGAVENGSVHVGTYPDGALQDAVSQSHVPRRLRYACGFQDGDGFMQTNGYQQYPDVPQQMFPHPLYVYYPQHYVQPSSDHVLQQMQCAPIQLSPGAEQASNDGHSEMHELPVHHVQQVLPHQMQTVPLNSVLNYVLPQHLQPLMCQTTMPSPSGAPHPVIEPPPIVVAAPPPPLLSLPVSDDSPIEHSSDFTMPGTAFSQSMHVVWAERFRSNFSNFRDRLWSLKPTMEPPTGDWKVHHDSAKIRFICKNDHNCWTSMKGRVVFWYAIDNGNGFVYFKLFGQQCKKCKKDEFQDPIWYPEEVVKVVDNIYYRVGQAYYNFSSQGPSSVQLRRDRRPGRPREQHDSTRCQACRDGLCTEART